MTEAGGDGEQRVDVVIPTIGRDSLRRAVESVLVQTAPARAIVVLDAADRRDEVALILPIDPRVHLVATSGGLGGAGARNVGLDASDAGAVAFLDDDDWWEPTSLERRLETVREARRLGRPWFVAGAFWHDRRDSAAVVPTEAPPYGDASALAAYLVVRKDLRFGRTAVQSSTIILSGDLARSVRWDAGLRKHQDWDFALRALAAPDVSAGWLADPTVHVEKDSADSISRRLDWHDSLEFLARHPELVGVARADFLAVHVLRAAIARGSAEGFRAYRAAGPGVPHPAAMVVAASALVRRGRSGD